MSIPVFRFAPSPNGRLHLGHAYSALLNAELAKRLHGRFLLRLEDIDTTRCTAALAQACLDDLSWLELEWERPVRVQSRHFADYSAALEKLKVRGLVYPCFCTRQEVAQASDAKDPDGAPIYPGTCARLAPAEAEQRVAHGAPHAWRLHMQQALSVTESLNYMRFTPSTMANKCIDARPWRWGDVIVARKDILTSYHLAVVVDDALQGVTHVVRGSDLEAATCLHRLLQALLGLPTPCYYHHALITHGGDKLSKTKGSEALADLRARGVSPQHVRRMLMESASVSYSELPKC